MILTAPNGLALVCDTKDCGRPASSVWSPGVVAGGHSAGQRYACDAHNPMTLPASLPLSFHGRSLCHACGQPAPFGTVTVAL